MGVVVPIEGVEDEGRVVFVAGEVAVLEEVVDTVLPVEVLLLVLGVVEVDEIGVGELLCFIQYSLQGVTYGSVTQ